MSSNKRPDAKFAESMPSLTEWMSGADYSGIKKFRQEDNSKRDRLQILYDQIGLPFDRPDKIMAADITERTSAFLDILKRKGNKSCALRLIPLRPGLPKLRTWGKSLKENLKWFDRQKIDPRAYRVEVVPQSKITTRSSIMVVGDRGIWGQMVAGPHSQLTSGRFSNKPVNFFFDFKSWRFTPENKAFKKTAARAVEKLLVKNEKKRRGIKRLMRAKFNDKGYLKGYFEFVVWPGKGIVYIDYNRALGKILGDPGALPEPGGLRGVGVSGGTARGRARIVKNAGKNKIRAGEILVCRMTAIEHIPLMKKASAIIAEQNGILSHAAIVARELKKPCIVGIKEATRRFKNGDRLYVNADNGTVQKIG